MRLLIALTLLTACFFFTIRLILLAFWLQNVDDEKKEEIAKATRYPSIDHASFKGLSWIRDIKSHNQIEDAELQRKVMAFKANGKGLLITGILFMIFAVYVKYFR